MELGVFRDLSIAQTTPLSLALERYSSEVLPTQKGGSRERSRIKHLIAHLGSVSLASISPTTVSRYRDVRLQTLSPQSVKHELSLLSRVFNAVIREWGIHLPQGNPVSMVIMPRLPHGRDRRLEPGEEDQLITQLRNNPMMKAIVEVALETAMRRTEIASVKWRDLDLRARTLLIPVTKTGRARRIPLSNRAVEAITRPPRRIDGGVFGLRPNSITQAFDRACKRAGINDLRFHDLRHEATSRLFEKGFNVMEVATITGHQDLRMLRRYTHIRAEQLVQRMK